MEIFSTVQVWNEESVRRVLMEYAAQNGLKTGMLMWPIRVAISGLASTPGGATEIAAILGKQEVIQRVRFAIERLKKV